MNAKGQWCGTSQSCLLLAFTILAAFGAIFLFALFSGYIEISNPYEEGNAKCMQACYDAGGAEYEADYGTKGHHLQACSCWGGDLNRMIGVRVWNKGDKLKGVS